MAAGVISGQQLQNCLGCCSIRWRENAMVHGIQFGANRGFFHPSLQALIYGCVILLFLLLADHLSMRYGLKESQRVVDDICGAVIGGLFVYHYECRRAKYLKEKLKTIELMN